MGLQRHESWDTEELDAFLRARARMPFVWGSNDCALFAADAVQALTGTDIAPDFRGRYTDEAGAFATIKAVCGGTTVANAAAYCAQKFGLVEWVDKAGKPQPLRAQRGDLVAVQDSGRLIAGIVGLNGHVAAVGEAGLKQIEITAVTRAWHY